MCNNKNMGIEIPENATQDERRAAYFNALYSLNVNEKTERKNNLSYLSWAWAWAEFKKIYPSATYHIIKNEETNLPYFSDQLGIMVYTQVTADDLTYEMWLPVMDSSNKAMKLEPYSYYVFDRYKNQNVEKKVEAATMFDINKTIMRCLVKNLAMFGIGLYIYAGEDIPEEITENTAEAKNTVEESKPEPIKRMRRTKAAVTDKYAPIKAALEATTDTNSLLTLYNQHKNEVEGNPEIKALFTQRKQQLQNTTKAA